MIEVEPTREPLRWRLHAAPGLCAGPEGAPFLYGGSALAALIRGMSNSTGRPPLWATAQYVNYITPGAVADINVIIEAEGRTISQASATLSVNGRVKISALGAFGSKEGPLNHAWPIIPDALRPDRCPVVRHRGAYQEGIYKRIEVRLASGRFPTACQRFDRPSLDGRSLYWIRPVVQTPMSPGLLAIIGDYISAGGSHALGRYCTGNSLDNTIRFISAEASNWILCDV
jgi:acyl-CoA thioesterase II